ncbi:uncharacterized protein N7482_007372 [Penicillium canariense]|uniref:DUF7053 domain-containing protein n=1 Tax=Penicillium canariense TaxID=189055 RepID=A0A9W9LK90_9EURO|nr:uncharacterized protein N7482_007372 [Penicillium canariense]KAJ5160368.1 hypothetical protein N7482_007372 [Penicillium canariense]
MMRKKESYTHITPIPASVPRQLALDILHSHGEIITLNPLVLSYHAIKAPRDAAADEYYSTWYEIIERVQYVPGLGKLGSGKISFKGCFHDTPWGLITHTFVPLGIDIRSKWRILGNQPDEPRKFQEFRVEGAPEDGLYLQEDIEINCNITLVSFVKSQMKASSKVLVDRLMKKAELLDAGVLQAIMEDGKLKTVNPADRSSTIRPDSWAARRQSDQISLSSYQMPRSASVSTRHSSMSTGSQSMAPFVSPKYGQDSKNFAVELPADFYHPQPSPGLNEYQELPDSSLDRGKTYTAEMPATRLNSKRQSQHRDVIHEMPESHQ